MSTVIKHPRTGREFALVTGFQNDNPHHGNKRTPKSAKYLVAHHTAGSTAGDLKVLRGQTGDEVSVKYLVADPQDGNYRDGAGRLIIWQLLPHDVIGWSIGATTGTWDKVENANSDSIEVSNLGNGKDPFEAEQVEAVEALIAYEENRCGHEFIVLGHREVAPGRKVDPQASFDLEEVKDFAAWHKAGGTEMAAKNKIVVAMVRPDRVASVIADLVKRGHRAYEIDADTARVTRMNPKGTAQ